MAAELVDAEAQERVQAEAWGSYGWIAASSSFFPHPSINLLCLLLADVEAQHAALVVTAGTRAAPRVCKPSLQAATLEKGIAPTVGKGEVVCLQFICCTHIKGWNTCLFILGNFMCLMYFEKKPKPLSE